MTRAARAAWATAAGTTLTAATTAALITVYGNHWTPWTAAWSIIAGCFVAGFAVVETLALANRYDGDTLSEHVWAVVQVRRHPTVSRWILWPARAVVFWLFAWLAFHFAFGWFTPTDPVPW